MHWHLSKGARPPRTQEREEDHSREHGEGDQREHQADQGHGAADVGDGRERHLVSTRELCGKQSGGLHIGPGPGGGGDPWRGSPGWCTANDQAAAVPVCMWWGSWEPAPPHKCPVTTTDRASPLVSALGLTLEGFTRRARAITQIPPPPASVLLIPNGCPPDPSPLPPPSRASESTLQHPGGLRPRPRSHRSAVRPRRGTDSSLRMP